MQCKNSFSALNFVINEIKRKSEIQDQIVPRSEFYLSRKSVCINAEMICWKLGRRIVILHLNGDFSHTQSTNMFTSENDAIAHKPYTLWTTIQTFFAVKTSNWIVLNKDRRHLVVEILIGIAWIRATTRENYAHNPVAISALICYWAMTSALYSYWLSDYRAY